MRDGWETILFFEYISSSHLVKEDQRETPRTHLHMLNDFIITYPVYTQFIRGVSTIPLTARSLIIKACQAQVWPSDPENSTLYRMIEKHPDVMIRAPCSDNGLRRLPLIDIIPFFSLDLQDPLESAIILDICRGMPLPKEEVQKTRDSSWAKEITLSQGTAKERSQVNWDVIFDPSCHNLPLFPSAEPNPNMARKIFNQLVRFREQVRGRRYYPRATHKNMSRSTRREFESQFHSLDGTPIFGQDDWQRVYHHTGCYLEGCCEMRQKWYPSGAKPRTYFAMGGRTYRRCRHLQVFFTDLVNAFVPTNQITRLQPDRLYTDPESRHNHLHYRVYDMTNFTSGMHEQKFLMERLARFFKGVEVELVDERDGLIVVDLGELLEEYNTHCVVGPLLSLERYSAEMTEEFPHGVASLLGIFGNLMTCTVTHYFIMSPLVFDEEEINIAGDDGILPEDEADTLRIQEAWDIVGECAREKTFRADEVGAICLKRPIVENLPGCVTTFNIIPPTLALASAYLSGRTDPRYSFFGLDELSQNRRISVVGRDLMRFLRSAYLRDYQDTERLTQIYRGFCALVIKHTSLDRVTPGLEGNGRYLWPISPQHYDFLSISPRHCLVMYHSPAYILAERMETMNLQGELSVTGDEAIGNMSPRIKLLERLGYIESEAVKEELVEYRAIADYWRRLLDPKVFYPTVYKFSVCRSIPPAFVGWS